MTRWQRLSGATLLGGILLFGVAGVVTNVLAGEFRYITDTVYSEECGACHLAYPPPLLPEDAWTAIMAGLEDHFGESAELDEETADHILGYLHTHALGKGEPSTMSKMMRNLPDELPLRITEYPAFIDAHALVKEQLGIDTFDEGFLSPCADCHRQASAAIFDKELLHPGYGPASAWGGKREQ
jgi:hypothetical protein